MKTPTGTQNKMRQPPRENKTGDVPAAAVTIRLRELPAGMAAMTVPSDRTIECGPELANLLIEMGYADRA
jgi:hypothetical protein